MPSNHRWSVSDGRKLATGILVVFAFFIISASIGAQSWELAALGVAVLAAGVTLYVVSAMNSRSFAYIPGTAHVISSTPPPAGALQGRCEMHVVVHAPGMDDTHVKIRDVGVPVSKWPDPGTTLPILVATADARRVRVLWDNVRTHGEIADTRGEVFDGEVAIDEPYDLFEDFSGIPDDGYSGVSEAGDDPYGNPRVIEFDIDPTSAYLEPDPLDGAPDLIEPGGRHGDSVAAPVPEQGGPTGTAEEPVAEASAEPLARGQVPPEAGPDAGPGAAAAPGRDAPTGPGGGTVPAAGEPGRATPEPLPTRPRPSRRPSPRPRRSVESVDPAGSMLSGPDQDGGDGGSQIAVVDRPAPPGGPATPPQSAVPAAPPTPGTPPGPATPPTPGTPPGPDTAPGRRGAAPEPAPGATERPPTRPGAAAAPGVEGDSYPAGDARQADGDRPTLRIQHLVPATPAVPAIPDLATPHSVLTEVARGEISQAYLAVTPPPGRESGPARIRGVGVTLFVSNLGRSVAFYRDVLGFEQVDVGAGSAVLESGGGRIELRRVADMAPVDRRLVHLLLEVPDVPSAYEDLRARGVDFVHRPRAVSRYEQLELRSAAFRDPDGHGIALIRWDLRH